MNINREQYEADIRKAKAEAWEECNQMAVAWGRLKQIGCQVDELTNPYMEDA